MDDLRGNDVFHTSKNKFIQIVKRIIIYGSFTLDFGKWDYIINQKKNKKKMKALMDEIKASEKPWKK